MKAWHVEAGSLLVFGSARLAIQRIGLTHWQPDTALRSWGVAPLHDDGQALWVPCAIDEALWLGLWSEPAGIPAEMQIEDPQSGTEAVARVGDGRAMITAGGPGTPLSRAGGDGDRSFWLHLSAAADQARIELRLLDPTDWSRCAQRPPPAPLSGPPPLPPRLG